MTDRKAHDVCEKFVRKESNTLTQYYHEEALHVKEPLHGHYVRKSTCWNMRDLERLIEVCKKSRCVFTMRSETTVYVWDY